MPIISTSLPSDGETIDAADVNTPFNDILNVVNGNIDSDNVATGGLNYENFGTITGEIPASDMQDSGNLEKFRDEANVAFVASGCVWSTLTGLNGAMTAGVVYNANGVRNAPGAVASKTFTASRDTYVDIATNGSVSYSEVVNNDPSPALTANYVRIAKVVTDGSAITSVTQTGIDSLGNKIYPSSFVTPETTQNTNWVWRDWSPTYTNLTIGNGTVTAKYIQIGKTVHFRWVFQLGSTSSVGTTPTITLPATASSTYFAGAVSEGANIGTAKFLDSGTANYFGYTYMSSTTQFSPQAVGASATYGTAAGVAATIPFTFSTGDAIFVTGFYEAA